MDMELIRTLGLGIGTVATVLGGVWFIIGRLERKIYGVRTELKTDIQKLDVKIDDVRTELKTDIKAVASELKDTREELNDLRVTYSADRQVLINLVDGYKDLKAEILDVKADFVRELNVEGRVNQLSQYIFGEGRVSRLRKKEPKVAETT
jgi:uncharacterized membrane-anchored protein YhcB (DUF1043 family)